MIVLAKMASMLLSLRNLFAQALIRIMHPWSIQNQLFRIC